MKKKATASKGGAKKTSRKARKRAKPAPKKKVITDRKDTVMGRLKNVFEDTATRIKTLLPGKAGTAAKQADPGDFEDKR
jgi:hypothetical protein